MGKCRKSVFLKDTIEWREWVLNRDHVDDKLGALTTRPHCRFNSISMSISLAPTFPISSSTTSRNLLFGLHLFLFPGNSISITLLPTYFYSLLIICSYHLSLPSLIFISNCSTLSVPLMYSFLILSFLITPIANLNIFLSAISISSTCFFVTATVSSPYIIVRLTTELYTFHFTLASNLLSPIIPDTVILVSAAWSSG